MEAQLGLSKVILIVATAAIIFVLLMSGYFYAKQNNLSFLQPYTAPQLSAPTTTGTPTAEPTTIQTASDLNTTLTNLDNTDIDTSFDTELNQLGSDASTL